MYASEMKNVFFGYLAILKKYRLQNKFGY